MAPAEEWPVLPAHERTHRGLVSLWDMLRFHADRFLIVMNLLTGVRTGIQLVGPTLREKEATDGPYSQQVSEGILDRIDEMGEQLDAMGLPMSRATLDRLRPSLGSNGRV